MTNFSDSEDNEQVLKHLAENGSDLSQPMLVDFQIAIPDEASGERFAKAAAEHGFKTETYFDEEFDDWTCECSKEIIATVESIREVEQLLGEVAAPFGGTVDGWGTYGNGEDDDFFDDEGEEFDDDEEAYLDDEDDEDDEDQRKA